MTEQTTAQLKANAEIVLKELKRHGLYSHEFILRKYIKRLEQYGLEPCLIADDLAQLSKEGERHEIQD